MTLNTLYWIVFIAVALLSFIVQKSLQIRFEKYSQIPLNNGMTGRDVAEKMLRDNCINNVSVTSVSGSLTDHFDPTKMTVNLSDTVYDINSVAAAAVAAHECGHAVQHARGYLPLKMRSALVPVVSFASRLLSIVLLAGMLLINIFPQLLLLGIVLFALTTLFSLVTLPVEINASRRALAWLNQSGITDSSNHKEAEKALRAAAYTYVVAAISSLATLFYYLLVYSRRN